MGEDSHEAQLATVDARCRSNSHRIDHLEQDLATLNSLAQSMAAMANEQGHTNDALVKIDDKVADLSRKVDVIENRPARRWEQMVDKILTLITAALIGYILTNIGL